MHAKQPSLPSIQYLLSEDNKQNSEASLPQRMGHRSTRSVGGELHLSIYSPALTETSSTQSPHDTPFKTKKERLSNRIPTWMQGNEHTHRPHCALTPAFPSLTYSHHQPAFDMDHRTSIPYLPQNQHQSPPFAAIDSASAFNPFPPTQLRSLPMDQPRTSYQHTMGTPLPPPCSIDRNQKQHRRTASASNVEIMRRNHLPISKSSSSRESANNKDKYSPNHNDQKVNLPMKTTILTSSSTSATSRYVCPYCQKRFSRPSSLRIHTYSHSGEKPFICPEIGCGRRFSVQSNQRRHLRVHRLSRHTSTNSALGGIM